MLYMGKSDGLGVDMRVLRKRNGLILGSYPALKLESWMFRSGKSVLGVPLSVLKSGVSGFAFRISI